MLKIIGIAMLLLAIYHASSEAAPNEAASELRCLGLKLFLMRANGIKVKEEPPQEVQMMAVWYIAAAYKDYDIQVDIDACEKRG